MRLANIDGRMHVQTGRAFTDVAKLSDGRFGPDPQAVLEQWPAFSVFWTEHHSAATPPGSPAPPVDPARLGPPVPHPRQTFAIGLNYGERAHAAGEQPPDMPPVFPKFQTCITGPSASVTVPHDALLDYEVELVVTIGVEASRVSEADAWSHVAGLMLGQDLSDRRAQFRPPVPQFGLSKSRPGFGPTGPFLLTPDELPHPDDLAIRCAVNGETRQSDRTASLLVPVARLITELSALLPLMPGDLIFTGTPGGVGHYLDPPRYLSPGDVLDSEIEGLGSQRVTFLAP